MLKNIITEFITKISTGEIEIYNEASVQYELAILLRQKLPGYKVQLERNISYFGLNKEEFVKREIDIVIYDTSMQEKHAIELKYPRNGQVPEEMFSFFKDIRFLEQLKQHGFSEGLFLLFVDDPLFWAGKAPENSIYRYWRGNAQLQGKITKPTGKRDHIVELIGNYIGKWEKMNDKMQFWATFI